MKNLNLIERLWTDSHEKQSPQRFARYAAMLIMLLTLGVGQMWATDLYVMNFDGKWSYSDANKMEGTSSPWVHYGYWNTSKEFKIATSDWSTVNLGKKDSNPTIGGSAVEVTHGSATNLTFPTPASQGGIYKITVTLSSGTYKVKIEAVATEQTTWRQISAPKIYWNNTDAGYTNVTMINGRYTNYGGDGKGTLASPLTRITNTNLWYNTSISNGTGDGSWFTSTLFVDANWDSWENNNVPTQRAMYAASNTAVNTASLNSKTFLFSAANGNRGATLSRSQLSSGYSELNKTQTVEVYVKVGSGSYTKRTSSWPGTLTPDRYYLSNATTASHVNNTALTASSSVTVSAVLTSAFSLSESSTADGYNFDGWGTSSSSTPSGKNAAYSISSITGANTICAFFTAPSYSITYNLNGGTQQVSPAPATSYTVESSAITLPTPTRDGYDFDGWFDNSSFTGSAITTIAAGSTGNKEYWAKWTEASTYYDVTFGVHESGNGTLTAVKTVNSASITSGEDLLSGTAITFTATPSSYYEVEGWYTNSACTLGKHDAGETTYSVASLGSDITVYVKFKPITYNITYNLNSGTNNPGNPATYTYESSAITLLDPTRDGYTFGGWYTEVGLTNRVYSIAAGSNGNKAFWAKWTEKMTTVTVNVSPSGAGTLTVGGAAFTPGNTTTAGVTTSRTVVATPASGKVFLDWSVSGNATGTNSTNTYTLKGNGSAGTGTLTANFGVASGWYMEGTAFGGWVRPNTATYQFARPYRGMENVFYYPASLAASSYWKVNDGTKPYSISNSTTAITKKTIYSLTEEWSNSTYASSAMTNIWVVLDKSNKKLWVQDPQTYYNVNVSGANDSKGPVKVTLKTTSAFTKGDNVFETTQFANGETFTITVTPVTGYIPTITIGGNTPVTWWKEQATYTADGTMSTSDITVTISYTPTRAVRFAKTTGCKTLTATGPESTSVSDNTKIKDGTEITFSQENSDGYTFSKWYSNNTGISGTTYSTEDDDYTLTVSSTAYTIYPIYTENMTTVNLVASPTGKGTFTSGDDAVTSVSAGVTTHPTVTAVPASGYRVNTSATVWSESSDYITISATNAASTTITGSGTSGNSATLTATFTPIVYTITLNDNEGSGGVGSATVTFDDDNFAFASSFVAPTRTGYIFQGYYTSSSMDVGDQLIDKEGNWHSDTEPYVYIDGGGNWIYPNNMTLYAGWTPITFTIHYDANGGSGSMDDQVAKYEVESSLDGQNSFISTNGFTAPTGYGIYYPAHPWNTSADGTGTDIDAATYQSTLTSTNGATVNLYAQWSGRFALKANYDGGVDGYFRIHYNTSIIETLTTLYPTRLGYLCDGYYTAAEDGTKVLNGNGTVVDGNVSGYVTGGKWTYKGTQDFYAHWNQIKYNLAFDGNDCAAYVGEATGSKASMANVEYETDVDITAGTLAREGYTFAGWSKTACATSPTYVGSTTRHISSTDGDNVTLYAVWNAKNYTISFNALGGDCYTTSKSVAMGANYGSLPTAYGNSGYEFVGWYTRPEGGTLVTEETQMVTASDHTLYAHYEKKERVYFKNTLGWESVYVTWDATWNYNSEDKGAGARGKTQELMSHIYGTDIWYKDVPAAILSSWKGNIAFTNIAMPNYDWFDDGQAVYRRDFDSDATMFVPTPNDPYKYTKNTHDPKPGTVYYSTDMIVDEDGSGNPTNYRYKNGYWVRYDELQSGYTVKGSWKWADDHYVERHSLDDSTYVFTIRNLSANSNYWFNLYKHCTTDNDYSSVFKPAADMTSASSDVVFSAQYAGGGDKKMTTTVAGDYTFKFVFSALGEIRLTIEYPLAVNDYRVVYGWNDGSAQTFSSEYIKAKADAVDTISMFIHSGDNATDRSLYIQKCTGITAGVPTWNTTYSAITLPSETASGKTSGVYNFRIAQNGSAAATGESIGKYDGNYYIRTDSAAGGWDFYKEYPSSQMTFSEYSLSQTLSAPYSHYYCQYVGNSSTDISYTIATDYSPAICPIQEGDATIGVGNKTLPSGKPASVRFTWNEETNATFRSYLKSAQGDGNKRFLVLHGSDTKVLDADGDEIAGEGEGAEQMHANELLFSDTENWVYELAFKAKPGAKVSIIARYNDVDRYLVGAADAWETIISGGADTKYDIAAVYDFKTNRLITTWIPSGTISDQIKEVDVLIERHNQDGATTITFGKAAMEEEAGSISAKRVIGALRFEYNELVGRVASWTPDTRAKMMFFVSFPFDVNVSDIFGLNTNYGEAFIVQGYNGAKRAEKGFFKGDGTDTFWETLPVDTVMHAGVGYVVTLDNDYFNGDVGHIWDNKRAGDHVYMYFPSANDPEHPVIINSDDKTINVPAHLCTINRTFNSGKLNHKYTDSNWNLMGVPIFQNHTGNAESGTPGAIFTATKEPEDTTSYANPENPAFGYFYVWNTDKTYTIQSAVDFVFKPMHSYMVQYAGDVKFTCAEPVVPSLAPRRTEMKENYNIELQVLNNSGDMLNHTYVELRENAVDSFALNEDIYMMSSNKAVSVYTFAGTYDVAANVLSIGSHVVPVGVIVKQAGTYTFTMPSNFSGTVTLVDTFAQTRTNLAIEDYEVTLQKGTDEERFYLEINPNNAPTAIDGVEDGSGSLKDGKAHKFIMNDMMYILKDGVLYDARGARVK